MCHLRGRLQVVINRKDPGVDHTGGEFLRSCSAPYSGMATNGHTNYIGGVRMCWDHDVDLAVIGSRGAAMAP